MKKCNPVRGIVTQPQSDAAATLPLPPMPRAPLACGAAFSARRIFGGHEKYRLGHALSLHIRTQVLTGTRPETEIAVTYCKQRTDEILTGTDSQIFSPGKKFDRLPRFGPVGSGKKRFLPLPAHRKEAVGFTAARSTNDKTERTDE
jgi:hypothetical protein